MTLFRPQRGTLADSMGEVVYVETKQEVVDIIVKIFEDFDPGYLATTEIGLISMETVELKYYCFDDRIDWDTWVVTINGMGIGFTNGDLK